MNNNSIVPFSGKNPKFTPTRQMQTRPISNAEQKMIDKKSKIEINKGFDLLLLKCLKEKSYHTQSLLIKFKEGNQRETKQLIIKTLNQLKDEGLIKRSEVDPELWSLVQAKDDIKGSLKETSVQLKVIKELLKKPIALSHEELLIKVFNKDTSREDVELVLEELEATKIMLINPEKAMWSLTNHGYSLYTRVLPEFKDSLHMTIFYVLGKIGFDVSWPIIRVKLTEYGFGTKIKRDINNGLCELLNLSLVKRVYSSLEIWGLTEEGSAAYERMKSDGSFTSLSDVAASSSDVITTLTPPDTLNETTLKVLKEMMKRHPIATKVNDLDMGSSQKNGSEMKMEANRQFDIMEGLGMICQNVVDEPPSWTVLEKGVECFEIAQSLGGHLDNGHQSIMVKFVLSALATMHPRKTSVLAVRKIIHREFKTFLQKKDVNFALNTLRDQGMAQKTEEYFPRWFLLVLGIQKANDDRLFQGRKQLPVMTSSPTVSRPLHNRVMLSAATPSTNNNGASSIDQEELGNTSNWETSGKKCTNAISVLNELAQTRNLDIDYTAQSTGPDHKRSFQMTLKLGKTTFPPVDGSTKKKAKLRAATQAIMMIKNASLNQANVISTTCTTPIKSSLNSSTASSFEQSPNASLEEFKKNPISMLHEYGQAHGVSVTPQMSRTEDGFLCEFKIGNKTFESCVKSCKKDAKTGAAVKAYTSLRSSGALASQRSTPVFQSSIELPLNAVEHDHVAFHVNKKFNEILAMLPGVLSARKVVAGFVMSKSTPMTEQMSFNEKKTWHVVSIGSGNRCIGGTGLCMKGQVVHDCHAEVIARRGLCRYLYREINTFLIKTKRKTSIFFMDGNKLRIKHGVEFHLYISTAPCGDGALFSFKEMKHSSAAGAVGDNKRHNPLFMNKKQGVLRTKVENGEGCTPIELDDNEPTWSGLLRGERLRTMSCSDKLMKWNLLGLQGALLSMIIEPIYMSSLTLGDLYHHGHLTRAICCRLDKFIEPQCKKTMSNRFKVNHPTIGKVTGANSVRKANKTKTREHSINWTYGDDHVEVLDGTQGQPVNVNDMQMSLNSDDEDVSCLARTKLYDCFKEICDCFGISLEETYSKTKLKATDYQNIKKTMIARFEKNGCGRWMHKPIECSDFS